MISNDDPKLLSLENTLVAHNLPGQVISDFVVTVSNASSEFLGLNVAEQEFKTSILDAPAISSLNGQYYVIAFPLDAPIDYRTIVTHEIHHAQFYLSPPLRQAVSEFWNSEISAEDRALMRSILGNVYNRQNEALMIDEFQAYMLQEDAEHALLSQFVGKFKSALIQ